MIKNRHIGIHALLLFALTMVPMFWVTYPVLQDLPNHLARIYIMLNQDDVLISRYYFIEWRAVPNMAFDLVLLFLGSLMPLAWAAKVFIAFTFGLIISGCLHLHYRLYGSVSCVPLLAALFLFNACFMQGFVNFLFGAGVLLHVLAFWHMLSGRSGAQFVFGLCAGLFLYFTHLYILALYGIFLFLMENTPLLEKIRLTQGGFWKRNIRLGLFFVVPFLLLVMSPTGEAGLSTFEYAPLAIKVAGLGSLMFFTYNTPVNLVLLLLLVNIFPLLCKPPVMKKIYVYLLLMLALYMVMPRSIMSSANADWRVVIPFTFFIIAHIDFNMGKKAARIFLTGLYILMFLQITQLYGPWQKAEDTYRDFNHVVKSLPQGSTVYPLVVHEGNSLYPEYKETVSRISAMHIFSFAVLEKHAFVPSLFVLQAQNPLRLHPPYLELKNERRRSDTLFEVHAETPEEIDWPFVQEHYDYVLVMSDKRQSLPEQVELIEQRGMVYLYKL